MREHLTDPVIGTLAKMGAGPATIRALRSLGKRSASLPAPVEDPIAISPAPSEGEQTALAGAVRRWSGAYLAALPDFICTRTVRQFHNYTIQKTRYGHAEAGYRDEKMVAVADDRWHMAGSFAGEIRCVGGHESFRLTAVDDERPRGTLEELGRGFSWGDVGGLMREILDPGSAAALDWDRWEVLRGRRMAVFRYTVDAVHTRYLYRRHTDRNAAAAELTMAHHGLVYADPRTGAVGRLVLYASGRFEGAPPTAVGEVLDYAEVTIAGNDHALPVRALTYSNTQGYELREEIEYRDYRKFESESTVKFE